MTRFYRALGIVMSLVAIVAAVTARPACAADEKPAITVVLPSTDESFNDLKFAFDAAKDEKGYKTLKETVELFLVGVDTTQPGGIRIYPTGDGLQSVLTFPIVADPLKFAASGKKLSTAEIKKRWPKLDELPPAEREKLRQAELKKLSAAEIEKVRDGSFADLISNLWDLDVKTAPAPSASLAKQIPKAVAARLPGLKLAPNERLIFGLWDGFLRYEAGQVHVHIGKLPANVRLAKGGMPVELSKGHDLAILIDGQAQTPEERKKAFEQSKQELLGALTKGKDESEEAFEVRKAITENQVAEIERFFVESSRIYIGWNMSAEKRNARAELELEALPGTSLEQSADLLGQTPDDFAGVSKTDVVFSVSGNFPLDAMRKEFLKTVSKLERAALKKEVAASSKLTNDQKAVDGDLVDLIFDVIDGIDGLGIVNGFIRSWSNDDGTLTTVGGGRIPEGARAKFEKMLEKLATRGKANKVETKVDSEGDIEIHKLTIADIQKDFPEFIGSDGAVHVGINDKTLWLASGDKSLERLKKAIQEANEAGPKPGLALDVFLKFGPFVEFRNNWHARNPTLAATAVADEKKADTGKKKPASTAKTPEKKTVPVQGLISTAELRKLALEAFKEGGDTMTLSIERQEKTIKLNVQFEEGLIRFVGKLMSKVVKENLEDE